MKYLEAWELIRLNEKLLSRYGGLKVAHSTNQADRVEALCCRIRSLLDYGEDRSLTGTAATYCEVIARGHAFSDANKRTAVNAMYLFFHRNDVQTKVPSDLADFIVKVSTGEVSRKNALAYIERNCLAY